MKSKKGEIVIAFVLIGMGCWISIDSYLMGIQSLRNPGPGLMPFVLGIILFFLGLSIWISALRNPLKVPENQRAYYTPELKVIVGILVCLIGYGVFIDKLGFLTTSYLVLLGLFWIGNPKQKMVTLVVPALVVAVSYLIFIVLLNVHFPAGFIERMIYGYFG